MRCEWEPAGAFQWSLIKKEALGYLQAAGEETARMKVRQVPDSGSRWITAHFHRGLVTQSAFRSALGPPFPFAPNHTMATAASAFQGPNLSAQTLVLVNFPAN